jgi:hypothetical protein
MSTGSWSGSYAPAPACSYGRRPSVPACAVITVRGTGGRLLRSRRLACRAVGGIPVRGCRAEITLAVA